MNQYKSILYVTNPNIDSIEGLKQALSTSRNNNASLHILLIYQELPDELLSQKESFKDFLNQRLKQMLDEANTIIKNNSKITTEVLMINVSPAVAITQYVLKHGQDMVIKDAEIKEKDEAGFKAVDMALLRKCPVSVYLAREIINSRDRLSVAVAIDPMCKEQEGKDLNISLLKEARALADSCNGVLEIVSCLDDTYESHLSSHPWVKVSDEELNEIISNKQNKHYEMMNKVIEESEISGKQNLHMLHGEASELLGEFAKQKSIDIMVMGTVARSGISGFIIGNTAETVFGKLNCTLLALKPNGFISPIRPYD